MKKTKFLILLLTLTFPVILYLFLRSYGENEFALPVFFDTQEKLFCNDSSLEESSLQVFDTNQQDTFRLEEVYNSDYKIVHFPNPKEPKIQTLKNELNRVFNTFDDLSINLLSLVSVSKEEPAYSENEAFINVERSNTYLYSENDKKLLIDCLYALPTKEWEKKHPSEETFAVENTLVLLDEKNRIRGYYDGYETKEVDRLILEIRVLLSNR